MSNWVDKEGRRHVGVMLRGRRVHRILSKGATTGDAKRLEAEIRNAIGQRGVPVPGDPPLVNLMADYLTHARARLRSPSTAEHHANRIGPWLVGRRASEARAVAAQIIEDLGSKYAVATLNRSLGTLKRALTLAWDKRATTHNFGAEIKRDLEHNERDVFLSIKQVKAIADQASAQVRAAIWIALYTGCRRGEILALTKADIGKDAITIRGANTKSLKVRTVPIVAPLRQWLKLVPLKINFEGLKTGFRRARVDAGMPHITFHDLRRSCGTLMIQAGVDLYVVSKLLGHSSVAVTQKRYAHLQIDRVRDGLEATFLHRRLHRRGAGKAKKRA